MTEMKEIEVCEETEDGARDISEELLVSYSQIILGNTPSKELTPERLECISQQAMMLSQFVTQRMIEMQGFDLVFRAPVKQRSNKFN